MFRRYSPCISCRLHHEHHHDRENQSTMRGNKTSDDVKGRRTLTPYRHHHTLQQIDHTPTETSSNQQRIHVSKTTPPRGGSNLEKDLRLSPGAQHCPGYGSYIVTPPTREATPKGVAIIAADKGGRRLSLKASHPVPHRNMLAAKSGKHMSVRPHHPPARAWQASSPGPKGELSSLQVHSYTSSTNANGRLDRPWPPHRYLHQHPARGL